MPALTLSQMREPEETASHDSTQRWLAVSEPLAVDDDPDWDDLDLGWSSHDPRARARD